MMRLRDRVQSHRPSTIAAALLIGASMATTSAVFPMRAGAAASTLGPGVAIPWAKVDAPVVTRDGFVGSFLDSGYLELTSNGTALTTTYPLTGVAVGAGINIPWGNDNCGIGSSNKGRAACIVDLGDNGIVDLAMYPPKWLVNPPIASVPLVSPFTSTAVGFDNGFVAVPSKNAAGANTIVAYRYSNKLLSAPTVIDGAIAGIHRGFVYATSSVDPTKIAIVDITSGTAVATVDCPVATCAVLDVNADVTVLARGAKFVVIRNSTGQVIFERTHGLNQKTARGDIVRVRASSAMRTRLASLSGSRLMWSDAAGGGAPDILEVLIPTTGSVTAAPTVVAVDRGILLDADRDRVVYTTLSELPPGPLTNVQMALIIR
jgi:hypothetical protein